MNSSPGPLLHIHSRRRICVRARVGYDLRAAEGTPSLCNISADMEIFWWFAWPRVPGLGLAVFGLICIHHDGMVASAANLPLRRVGSYSFRRYVLFQLTLSEHVEHISLPVRRAQSFAEADEYLRNQRKPLFSGAKGVPGSRIMPS